MISSSLNTGTTTEKFLTVNLATHYLYNNLIMVENKLDLIFKAYDVRGVYGETLTKEIAYNIGVAFSQFVESETIIVGHDGRNSNLEISSFRSRWRHQQR